MAHLRIRRKKKRYVGSVMVNGKRKEKWFPDASKTSQRAAVAWETEEQGRLQQLESQTDTQSLTIQGWINEYMDDVLRRELSKKTYAEKRSAFIRLVQKANISPSKPVDGIDRYLVKKHLDKMVDSGLSGYAANKDRKNLGAAWKWGSQNIRDWPVAQNPFHAIPKYPERRSPRYVPTDADFWKFTDHLEARAQSGEPEAVQDYVMHQVFLHLAARRGEVFRLKRQDLDFDQDRIRLWTRKRKGSQLEYDWLPMPAGLRAGILRWLEIRLKLPVKTDHVFICLEKKTFCTEYYLGPFALRRHFMTRMCKELQISPFGYHAIRHFTASHLFAKGYSVHIIQTILRHKSPSTTEKYLRNIGHEPAVRKALEDGITRPAKVIVLDQKKMSGANV
jgi:integrase